MRRGAAPAVPLHRVVPEPLRQVGDDFEDEYPGAGTRSRPSALPTCSRQGACSWSCTTDSRAGEYQLSASARQVLAVVEGAGQPLEPSVIAERVLITTGSMTSMLDTFEKRGLIQRMPHPDDRRKLLIDITPDAQAILDDLLPSLHARETK